MSRAGPSSFNSHICMLNMKLEPRDGLLSLAQRPIAGESGTDNQSEERNAVL